MSSQRTSRMDSQQEADGSSSRPDNPQATSEIAMNLRTWPRVHPSRGQIRSCIEFSPAAAVSVPTSSIGPDGSPIRSLSTGRPTPVQDLTGTTSRSSSIHEISGAASSSSGGAGSGGGSSSSQRPSSVYANRSSIANPAFLDLNHLIGLHSNNFGLDFGDDDPHSTGSSAMDHDHDSLEDLHRQQDAEFQDILADFADQQHELEQRKPCTTSNTSLSLSSIVSNDDTSESSCGTLSEIFESLSRFSEHCLASVEALGSPVYLNSSSFTTTPTGPSDNFGFNFDYDESLLVRGEDGTHLRERQIDLMQNIPRRRHSSVVESQFRFDPSVHGHQPQGSRELSRDPATGLRGSINHAHHSRAEFFRSMLDTQRQNIEQEESHFSGFGSDTGGHSCPNPRHSSRFSGQAQGNQSQIQPQEGSGTECAGSVTENASHRNSKNILLDIGLELEIFSVGLEFENIMGFPAVPSTSSGGCGVGPSGENSIAAALSVLRESGPLVSALDWQERCMELELALQRFGEQAARVRLMLRDKEGELPYQLSFRLSGSHICGASIISPTVAVTAGHCIVGTVRTHSVIAGEHSLRTNSGNEQERTLARIQVHPEFNSNIYTNDIAILVLAEPLEFNEFVQAIALPESMVETTGDIVVSGWGALSAGGSSPDILQKVSVPVVDDVTCRAAYSGVNNVAESMLCAGVLDVGGRDSCQGDSGGPLVQDGKLVGVVSWGVGCAEPGYPGVNTQVSYFIEFINSISA